MTEIFTIFLKENKLINNFFFKYKKIKIFKKMNSLIISKSKWFSTLFGFEENINNKKKFIKY